MFVSAVLLNTWEKAFRLTELIPAELDYDLEYGKPTEAQWNSYEYLKEYQAEVLQSILSAVLAEYPEWQEDYRYEFENLQEIMPDIAEPGELTGLIRPEHIFFMNVEKEDTAYIGVQFHCSWDPEEGLGVMIHKERVVHIGSRKDIYQNWIAENDRDSREHHDIKSGVKMACNIRF